MTSRRRSSSDKTVGLTSTRHRSQRARSINAVLPLTLAYVASAFGWRTWKQWRTTGDSGLRIGRAGTSSERVAGALFATSVAAAVASAAERPTGPGATRTAGLALMTTGLLGTLAAQVDLGQSWRIGVDPAEETDLVTTGAFSVVRNPIFTAMATFGIGAAVAQRTPVSTVAALSMIAAVQTQVRVVEEPYLRAVHGTAYESYTERTGRFLPKLTLGGRRST